MKYLPKYDPEFRPAILELQKFSESVKHSQHTNKLFICVERHHGYNYHYEIEIFLDGTGYDEYNYSVVERIVKTILWTVGGYKIYVAGSSYIANRLKEDYSATGVRSFDYNFMMRVYKEQFEVLEVSIDDIPPLKEEVVKIENNLEGYRIGFDAGGSDRKVSAVVDGEVIFSTETVWHPKVNSDPNYHYERIVDSLKLAASKMPRVDAIGISSAGIYIDNEPRVASLFIQVPDDVFDEQVTDIYIRAVKEIGDVPFRVVNDGEVTALAGANSLNDNEVLGIAMGTSEAVGYVNSEHNLTGWLNELAFAPVDFNKNAMVDEWSGDYGCGVKYFSQDGVIKLATSAGVKFTDKQSPAEKLKQVQEMFGTKEENIAEEIFSDIGIYLGYTLAYYAHFYKIKHVLLLGRVMSGKGGDLIIEHSKKVLSEEFPQYKNINITTPDEYTRRVGQSIAAASLPEIK